MPNTTIFFGLLLVLLGIGGFVGTGSTAPTALIPAAFGLVLLITGIMARKPEKRKMAMHIAVVFGLLGFMGSVPGLVKLGTWISGGSVARPAAVVSQSIMALLTGIFTFLCVRSFIRARASRA